MELVLRTAAVYALLWLLMRVTGKRELAALGPFDLVLIVVIGDVVQQAVTQEDMSFTGALIVLSTMGTIVLGVSAATRRSDRLRAMIDGHPTTVVHEGDVVDEALRLERLPAAELMEAARGKGIDDLAKVRFAIIEPNGTFSFITFDDNSDGSSSDGNSSDAEADDDRP
jgi:uncharacterized membrane protein YcaP (DUF421 family)